MKKFYTYLFIIISPIISSFIALTAAFAQTTPFMQNTTYIQKLLTSEFWATLNVLIYIPYLRIANEFLNPAQLLLYGYFVSFATLLVSNKYFFISHTSYDDYVAMFIMFCAMGVSVYKIFN